MNCIACGKSLDNPVGAEKSTPEGWIHVGNGKIVDLFDPEGAEVLTIEEVALALSRVARFGGHTREDLPAYDVALHSVGVSNILYMDGESLMIQLFGLIHDASEAVLGDVQRPLKYAPFMQGYRDLEARWEKRLYLDFCGRVPTDIELKILKESGDDEILAFEAMNFMEQTSHSMEWWKKAGFGSTSKHSRMASFAPTPEARSRALFLEKYSQLKKQIEDEEALNE